MNIKSALKNKRLVLTAAVCIAAVIVICAVFGLNRLWQSTQGSDIYMGVTVNGNQRTSFYFSQADGIYYAFLPSYTSLESSCFSLDVGASLSFDGEKAYNGASLENIKTGNVYDFSLQSNGVTTEGKFAVKLSKNIPTVFIDTESGSMQSINNDKNYSERGTVKVINSDGTYHYNGTLEYIKGRGNSSWDQPKKPYQIKLDESADIFDMGSAKKWILIAEYNDLSLVRNKIVFDCAKSIGLEYTPDSRFVDLYLNGEYVGLYLLSEKIEICESRVDITDLDEKNQAVNTNKPESYASFTEISDQNSVKKGKELPNFPDDISGGYLMELDLTERFDEESGGYITERGQAVVIKEPECPSREQVDYISKLLQEFEDAIFAPDGICPTTGKHFSEYIDLESWAKKYLIEEVFQNFDCGISSQYFYKDAGDEKLYAGPVWDYDLSMGNFSSPVDVLLCDKEVRGGGVYNRWLSALYSQSDFYNEVVKSYKEYFSPFLKQLENGGLEEYQELIKASAEMDRIRFGRSEEEVLNDLGVLHDFVSRRESFLTEVWTDNAQYCVVTVIPPQNDGRFGFFSVKKGEKFVPAYGLENDYYNYDWFVSKTDLPFDLNVPITEDVTIYSVEKGTINQ